MGHKPEISPTTVQEDPEYGWPYEISETETDKFRLGDIPEAVVTIAEGTAFVGKSITILAIHGLKTAVTKIR